MDARCRRLDLLEERPFVFDSGRGLVLVAIAPRSDSVPETHRGGCGRIGWLDRPERFGSELSKPEYLPHPGMARGRCLAQLPRGCSGGHCRGMDRAVRRTDLISAADERFKR